MVDRLTSTVEDAEGTRPTLTVVGSVDHAAPRDNKKHRIAEWKERFAARTLEPLHEAMGYLSHYVGGILGGGPLSDIDLAALMREALAIRTTREGFEARWEDIRSIVFEHITTLLDEEGVGDPENTSGYVAVPSTGKKFCREGAGYGPPIVDWDVIREGLTDEQWERVVDTEVIETPNRDSMADLVIEHPDLAVLVRKAMSAGKPKTPKFQIRDMGENDFEEEDNDD